MQIYLDLVKKILSEGQLVPNRTGIDTLSIFGETLTISLLQNRFPLLTTKKMAVNALIAELLWFLEGSTSDSRLRELTFGNDTVERNTIWTANIQDWGGKNNDDAGKIYSYQWRNFGGSVDQIRQVVESLKSDPHGRRHLVSAWAPNDLKDMALPPCHVMFQFYVVDLSDESQRILYNTYSTELSSDAAKRRYGLCCQMYQRSVDVALGLPFNIASYALLTYLIANHLGYIPLTLKIVMGDVHLYNNSIAQMHVQLRRKPRIPPKIDLSDFDMQTFDDVINNRSDKKFSHDMVKSIRIHDYWPDPPLKISMAV